MSGVIESLERAQLRKVPDFQAGDRVKVHFQVVEGSRRRTQVFEGTVIKRQGSGARETFTVRKQSFGVGVERTFPLHSPKIERIEVASRGDVRRAKLYYLRGRVGRRARVRERQFTGPLTGVGEELGLAGEAPEVLEDASGTQAEAAPPAAEPGTEGLETAEDAAADVEDAEADAVEADATVEPEAAGSADEPTPAEGDTDAPADAEAEVPSDSEAKDEAQAEKAEAGGDDALAEGHEEASES
jgi:large subunit ribosomal protein L19